MQDTAEFEAPRDGAAEAVIRSRLLGRRSVLARAADAGGTQRMAELLREVDTVLERLDDHTWGLCERCHESVEEDRLAADLIRQLVEPPSPLRVLD